MQAAVPARRKRRAAGMIPLSAMGDVAFLLLIFYIATTMVTDQKPRTVEVPELASPSQNSPYPLVIYVDAELAGRDEAYFFNERIHLAGLGEAVRERAAFAPAAVRVYLNIERDLPYRQVDRVIEELKNAGIRRMIITTRPEAKS